MQAALGRDRRLAALARDDWWTETFIMLAGMTDAPSWLVRQVARENAWLAYWCLLEGQGIIDEDARLAVEQATTEALTSPRRDVRLRAVQALSGMANPHTVEPLITALGDEDETVASVAQRALVRMGEGAVEPLMTALRDEVVGERAASALGQVGEPAIGPLEVLTEDRKSPILTRIWAGNALVGIGERRADVSPLIASISDPRTPLAERLRAGNELDRTGDPRFYGHYLEPELIIIPKSEFWMGSESKDAFDNEKPINLIHLDTYWIAKYPVTNAQFKCFVDAGGYNQEKYWAKAGWAWRQGEGEQSWRKHRDWPEGWEDGQFPPERANHPVVYVTWHEALAYARWLAEATGKPYRLPTEAQWEKAARGDKDRRGYPWGDDFDAAKCNMANTGIDTTSAVGMFPGGASPYGVLDMSGNVWEWCSSLYRDYPYNSNDGREDLEAAGSRVLRGGAFYADRRYVRCAYRLMFNPYYFFYRDFGFRVVLVAPGFPSGL